MRKPIVKLTYTLFCFQEDAVTAREALQNAFGECDADLYGGTTEVTEPTEAEALEARHELESMSGDFSAGDEDEDEDNEDAQSPV